MDSADADFDLALQRLDANIAQEQLAAPSLPNSSMQQRPVDGGGLVLATPTGAFGDLLFYSILLMSFPIIAYLLFKDAFLERYMGMAPSVSVIYWAVVAVIGVHVVLGALIYKSYWQVAAVPTKTTKAD